MTRADSISPLSSRHRLYSLLIVLLGPWVGFLLPNSAGSQGADQGQGSGRLDLNRYMDLEGVGSPRISPDGSTIVYVRERIDPMTDSRRSALWIMDADGSRNRDLSEGSSARWSPSGDRLAFLGCGTAGGDPTALEECPEGSRRQLYTRIMSGEGTGSITQVTRLAENASNPSWSPDGTRLAFVAFVPDPEEWRIDLPRRPHGASWTEDPLIVDGLWYRRDRRGLFRRGREHIFVVAASGGTPRRITPDLYDHEDLYTGDDPEWSPDGSTIYFDGLRSKDADYRWTSGGYAMMESEIHAVDVESAEVRQLTHRRGADKTPKVSPDGRLIAYLGIDSTSQTYVVPDIHLMKTDGTDSRVITGDFDREPSNLIWAPDGSGIYFTAEDKGSRDLFFASRAGGVRRITEGTHVLSTTDISGTGVAVGVWSAPHVPEVVVVFSTGDPVLRRLTHVNDDLLADVQLGEVEEIWYESVGGYRVQGWLVKPPGFDPQSRYPLILSIHGGPHSMYNVGFNYSFQNYAANGYVVLYTNPRGSSGYGEVFGNAINKAYPGEDFEDLMNGVDEVIGRGYVDANSLFVTGCSGGGILTAWIVGHTDRFAAAVARCPITNWLSFVGTVDGPYWYNQFAQRPWQDPSEHLRRSPLMYVGNVKTPTLLMTGVKDLRTPIAQTEEFYQALKMERVPTKMIRMNDEWHGTTSQPSNFMRTQLYVMKWFETYMTEEMRRIVKRAGDRPVSATSIRPPEE
jgi:dipeptidyl aminopeptidase/acylaminoacyl peptidase